MAAGWAMISRDPQIPVEEPITKGESQSGCSARLTPMARPPFAPSSARTDPLDPRPRSRRLQHQAAALLAGRRYPDPVFDLSLSHAMS